MESIRELRRRCQGVHENDWTFRPVRIFSIYLTWLLIPTGISANAVSITNVLVGLAAAGGFAIWGVTPYAVACALMLLNALLDGVDGEIARYRGNSSLTGLYLDRLNSVVFYPSVLIALGYSLGQRYEADLLPVLGAVAAWGFVGLRLIKANVDVSVLDALRRPHEARRDSQTSSGATEAPNVGEVLRRGGGVTAIPKIAIDFLLVRHLGFVGPVFIAAVAELVLAPTDAVASPLAWLLALYAILVVLAAPAGVLLIVRGRAVDATFEALRRD